MPYEDTKILDFHLYKKSDKAPFIIYVDTECLTEKIDECKNNSENSFTTNVSEHILSGFSMSAISPFKSKANKHDIYRGKDCMKKFCGSLGEHAMKTIDFKKKKMKLLTNEQQNSYHIWKICIFVKKIENKHAKDKKYLKVRDCCNYTGEYRGAAHSICNLKYSVSKEIPVVFYNGSNYDYHFFIEELAEKFKKQFNCLQENTEKCITFSVSIEKEDIWIDKSRKKVTKTVGLQFIDSARFMGSS